MIHVRDATMLALTKLRTRKVRLAITIVVSGLLFSGLAGASLVVRGVMGGVAGFGKEGLGDRYITAVYSQKGNGYYSDQSVMDRAVAIQKEIVAKKKAEAKRLDIPYDAAAEPSPVQEFDYPGGKQRNLDTNHPATKQAISEYIAAHPNPYSGTLQTAAKPYDPKAFYTSKVLPYDLGGTQFKVLTDGKESYDQTDQPKGRTGPPSAIESFASTWTSMSSDLLKPFILPGQQLQIGADGSIPIIAPRSAAEQLLQLKSLPASATAYDKLERIKEIRDKAPKTTFSVCYRNTASATLLNQAITAQQDIDKNKNNKDYRQPSLVYGLPAEACGAIVATRDVRSAAEKTLADKQRQFDGIFGATPAEQSKVTFRIVGIVPDADYSSAFSVGQIIQSLVASSLGNGWFTPAEAIAKQPLLTKLFDQSDPATAGGVDYVEFNTATQARSFIKDQNCDIDYNKLGPTDDVANACFKQNKPFTVTAYGSNSLALESAKKGFGKFFRIAALIVSAIAAIIMMGTVGRMIADSRRETAVFRAIGAKKLDIAQIYVTYAVFLSTLIFAFALTLGLCLALFVNHQWGPGATIQAITAYNIQDLDKTFSLYQFYVPDMLLLLGLTIAVGLLSASLPLLRNSRRNPIRDMRDDT
jgi:hypothetical protein